MASISELVNNITGSINGFLSSNDVVTYHKGSSDYQHIQSQINQSNWSKLSFPYTFSVVNIVDPSMSATSSGFSDFSLPLAPQAISQREEPATSIKPSQGGTTVSHNGLGYKILSISGTTGIAPFRGEGGVERGTGEAIFQPKELKYKSGYEVFLHLRNWFRTYYEWKKKQGDSAKDFRLVFRNYKDGEFLIVELQSFEMDRQAAQSFLYNYKLEFKVLAHFKYSAPLSIGNMLEQADAMIGLALDKINLARGILLRTQGILRQVESTYNASVLEPLRSITLAAKAAVAIPLVAADISTRIIVNTISTAKALKMATKELYATLTGGDSATLAEINSLVDKRFGKKDGVQKTLTAAASEIKQKGSVGLMQLGALLTKVDTGSFPQKTLQEAALEQELAAELPRSYYENALSEIERVKKNAEDLFGLGSESYDEIFDRVNTLEADAAKEITDDEYDVLYALNEAITGIQILISTNSLFKSTMDAQIQDMNEKFNNDIQLRAAQAVRQITYVAGMSLERIAQRELGDSTRWGEIVEINGLKPPYVSNNKTDSREGILKPGSVVLIPAPMINGFSTLQEGRENKLTKNMNTLEKSLGVDLKVDKNFDLQLTPSGDIELIAGTDNLVQGTILKLTYEPGDVLKYPMLGTGLVVGSKFGSIENLADNLTKSLLLDTRINKVSDISIVRENSMIALQFNIHIKNVDIPVPVKIKL